MCRRFLFLGASLLFGDSTCGGDGQTTKLLRKEWDSNHGTDKPFTGFRVRPIRSLWHLSLKYHKGTWIFGPLFRKRYFFFLPASECFHPETIRVSFKERSYRMGNRTIPVVQLVYDELYNWYCSSCTTGICCLRKMLTRAFR